jgi:hypothetical protein
VAGAGPGAARHQAGVGQAGLVEGDPQAAGRVIGAPMVVAGSGYIVNTLALILSPALTDRLAPGILLPVGLAELSLAPWLAAKGVQAPASSTPC